MERKKIKQRQIVRLIISITIFILLFFISSRLYYRFDLTEDKRFTINPSTQESIKKLEDIVFFKVYLEGELPGDFVELRQSVLDILNEFRAVAPLNIEYDFVNPSEDPDLGKRRQIFRDLIGKGMQPYTIRTENKDGIVEKYVFPALTISYRERQLHINLFSNNSDNPNTPLEQLINEAKERLEYTILNAIKSVTTITPKSVAILGGWGSLERIETYDAALGLSEMYDVGYLELKEQIFSLVDTIRGPLFDAIIVAKPTKQISEKNKYLIDQYIMHGGKVLWLLDYIDVNMDSLANSRTTTAMPLGRTLNLDDMLFRYGVRINPNIIQDLQAAPIPVNTALAGAEPQFTPVPWIYFPVITPLAAHPITRQVSKIRLEFPSTIDTIPTKTKVDKHILLTTSEYSRAASTPALIDLGIINQRPNPNAFRAFPLTVAVLLEGEFESIFKNIIVDEISQNPIFRYKDKSEQTSMIVVSDGDIVKNYYSRVEKNKVPYPLGADKWFKDIYYAGNKEFILNSVNYLTNDHELMKLRGRKLKLRLLDRVKTVKERTSRQTTNVIFPPAIVIILGIIYNYIRHRRYA